jgi:hypothetical protein
MAYTLLYYSPFWFLGYDILLECLFALVTFAVAMYSFRIYKISSQKELKFFGVSFFLISLSYFLWAILNGFAVSKLAAQRCCFLDFNSIGRLLTIGAYAHIVFFLAGLVTLTYTSFKTKNYKIFMLLSSLVLLIAFLVEEKYLILYLLSAVLFFFIAYNYLEEYQIKKNKKVLLILIAFVFLFFGRLGFVFSLAHQTSYVFGHLLELLAYTLILISLILVIKHRPKKIIP